MPLPCRAEECRARLGREIALAVRERVRFDSLVGPHVAAIRMDHADRLLNETGYACCERRVDHGGGAFDADALGPSPGSPEYNGRRRRHRRRRV
jgi:hypothetical protein